MEALLSEATQQLTLSADAKAIVEQATQKIAPTWPLDQMIAVNPFWEMREQDISAVAARLSMLARATMLPSKAHFLRAFEQGDITPLALSDAAKALGHTCDVEELVAYLHGADELVHWHNIADLLDNQRSQHKVAWRDEITHQISQFCAAHYQEIRPMLRKQSTHQTLDLYQHWLEVTGYDRGLSIILDEPGLGAYFRALPSNAEELLAHAIKELAIDDNILEPYAHALLLDINGWASWVAYQRWQGDLYGENKDQMLQLLAIRMAWDLVIWRYWRDHYDQSFTSLKVQWQREKEQLPSLLAIHQKHQAMLWVWAHAQELRYQQQLNQQLRDATHEDKQQAVLQAAFCIDVRSEPIRRALEAQDKQIQTLGFAGFFGLPISYKPRCSVLARAQLPGLLRPIYEVKEQSTQQEGKHRGGLANAWHLWSQAAPSGFSMVESMGWLYTLKMLANSFLKQEHKHPFNQWSHQQQWQLTKNQQEVSIEEQVQLASGILNAMGITEFAPTVLLVGHASKSANNLHAAALDCGACGGQSGEVNVRVLAELLNKTEVRRGIAEQGISIPENTKFVAALHNTTTEQIDYFDANLDPQIDSFLGQACAQAQREKVASLMPDLVNANAASLKKQYIKRSRDWSQVRPEWGLANNAAFIVAPRAWTKLVNLEGRCFLHDYTWQNDHNFATLELIITAPMIVTHWINMQYNASVTDNYKYGSGNKILHNAVGGSIGVFEGNGGDLRIGLSKQSLHDGERWRHQVLRLSVYVAAPKQAIENIVNKHQDVKHLIDNQWLFFLHLGDDQQIERFFRGQWIAQ